MFSITAYILQHVTLLHVSCVCTQTHLPHPTSHTHLSIFFFFFLLILHPARAAPVPADLSQSGHTLLWRHETDLSRPKAMSSVQRWASAAVGCRCRSVWWLRTSCSIWSGVSVGPRGRVDFDSTNGSHRPPSRSRWPVICQEASWFWRRWVSCPITLCSH